jgi:peptidoglycan/xylan/chitin deacetylase (PgdA/CDA1 family)
VGRTFLGTVSHVLTQEPVVALTFDDGPDPETTPRLLDALRRHDARATFFMLGHAAKRFPALVRQVADEGHAIGNHSWDHPSFPHIGAAARRRQIRDCGAAIAPYAAKLLRPPYGNQNVVSRLDALWLGYTVVTWNIDSEDWYRPDGADIAQRLRGLLAPGDIVVMHDAMSTGPTGAPHTLSHAAHLSREPMLVAVDTLLGSLGGRLRFVTVPDLLRCGQPVQRNWYVEDAAGWARLNA